MRKQLEDAKFGTSPNELQSYSRCASVGGSGVVPKISSSAHETRMDRLPIGAIPGVAFAKGKSRTALPGGRDVG